VAGQPDQSDPVLPELIQADRPVAPAGTELSTAMKRLQRDICMPCRGRDFEMIELR
jgi:hypothetical protein